MRIFTRQHKRWLIGLLALILVVAAIYLRRARPGDAQSGSTSRRSATRPQEIPVVTAVAKTGDMKVYLNGLGSVVPYNTITVKSRVDGQLVNVLFKEGQTVSSGELLAEIDQSINAANAPSAAFGWSDQPRPHLGQAARPPRRAARPVLGSLWVPGLNGFERSSGQADSWFVLAKIGERQYERAT